MKFFIVLACLFFISCNKALESKKRGIPQPQAEPGSEQQTEVQKQARVANVPAGNPNDPQLAGNMAINLMSTKSECETLKKGMPVSYQFKGNYLARWSTYEAVISIGRMVPEYGTLRLKFDTDFYGRFILFFNNEGKLMIYSNYHSVRIPVYCPEKNRECNQVLDEILATIAQIKKRPSPGLDTIQTDSLQCLQEAVGIFRQAIEVQKPEPMS